MSAPGRGPSSRRFDGKRALVVGGASGIGRASASRLAAEGARVAIADVRDTLVEEVAAGFRREHGDVARAYHCDVAAEAEVRSAFGEAVRWLGGLDVLVTTAGIFTRGVLEDVTLADWEWVLRVNLTGTYLCIREALPHLVEAGGGAIVTLGSVSSFVVGAGNTAASYKASKAAVAQLTRCVAVEYAAHRIRANCVCPAGVDTNFSAHGNELAAHATSVLTRDYPSIPTRAPLARWASPEEVAATVAFLASDEASFVTGAAILVDGGYTAI